MDKCLLDVINDPDALSTFLTPDDHNVVSETIGDAAQYQNGNVMMTVGVSVNQSDGVMATANQMTAQLVNPARNTSSPITRTVQATQYQDTVQQPIKSQFVGQQVIGQPQVVQGQVGQPQVGQIINTAQGQTVLIPSNTLQTGASPNFNVINLNQRNLPQVISGGSVPQVSNTNFTTANQISLQGTLIQTSTGGHFLIPNNAIVGQQVNIGGLGNVMIRPQVNSSQLPPASNVVNIGSQIQLANGTVIQLPTNQGSTAVGGVLPSAINVMNATGAVTNTVQSNTVSGGVNVLNLGQGHGGQIIVQRNAQTGQNIILKTVPSSGNYVQIQPAGSNTLNTGNKKLLLPQTDFKTNVVPGRFNPPPVIVKTVTNLQTSQAVGVCQSSTTNSFPAPVTSSKIIVTSTQNTPQVSTNVSHIPMAIQKPLLDINNQIKKLSSKENPSEEDKRVIEQLKGMSQNLLAQVKLYIRKQSTPTTSQITPNTSHGPHTTSGPSHPTHLVDLLANDSKETNISKASSRTIKPILPQGVPHNIPIPTHIKVGEQVFPLAMSVEKKQRLEEQLTKLRPEQQKVFLKNLIELTAQKKMAASGQATKNIVIPITVQQVGKGINQIRPVLLTPVTSDQKAVKRPSTSIAQFGHTKTTILSKSVTTDQLSVLKPDCKTAFSGMKDIAKRLLRYHIYQAKDSPPEQLLQADRTFETLAESLLHKSSEMLDKYRGLLWDDSRREDPSAEMVMIDRMFIQNEQQLLAEDKRFAKENPGEYDVSDLDKSLLDSDIDVVGCSEEVKTKMNPVVMLQDIASPKMASSTGGEFTFTQACDVDESKPKLKLSIKVKPKMSDTGELLTPIYAIKTPAVSGHIHPNIKTEPPSADDYNVTMATIKTEQPTIKTEPHCDDTKHNSVDTAAPNNDTDGAYSAIYSSEITNGYVDPVTGMLTAPPCDGASDAESEPYGLLPEDSEHFGVVPDSDRNEDDDLVNNDTGDSEMAESSEAASGDAQHDTPGHNTGTEEVQNAIESILDGGSNHPGDSYSATNSSGTSNTYDGGSNHPGDSYSATNSSGTSNTYDGVDHAMESSATTVYEDCDSNVYADTVQYTDQANDFVPADDLDAAIQSILM